jgi:hypothetical protein
MAHHRMVTDVGLAVILAFPAVLPVSSNALPGTNAAATPVPGAHSAGLQSSPELAWRGASEDRRNS